MIKCQYGSEGSMEVVCTSQVGSEVPLLDGFPGVPLSMFAFLCPASVAPPRECGCLLIHLLPNIWHGQGRVVFGNLGGMGMV